MSKQNQRGMKKPNFIKYYNSLIKQKQSYALKHPCGFPHNTEGKELYFDEIQSLLGKVKFERENRKINTNWENYI